MYSKEFIVRFWNKVDRQKPDECWNWTGSKSCGGYGNWWADKKKIRAHRLAWQITNGTISPGQLCLHKCDNPSCVNPSHLYIGTHKDNMRDKLQRFRRPDHNKRSLFFNTFPL